MTENPPEGPRPEDPATPPPAAPSYGSTPPPAYGSTPPPPAYGQPAAPPPAYGQQPYTAGGYGAPGYAAGPAGVSDADRKLWSMLAHLGGIILGFVSPLIVWAIYKDRDQFIRAHSVEALNFQLTVIIAYVVSGVLTAVAIGFLTGFAVWIVSIVFSIIAGLAANRGEPYRYPVNIRFIK